MASSNEIKARIVGAEADRASVEQVLAAIGVTAKVGGSWASCPLCSKKKSDQTFKVNENGTCQCQKCQRVKNVLDLVMELRGFEFLDAIGLVGEVIGLPLDRNGRPGAMPSKGARPAARDFRPAPAEPKRTIPVPIGKPQRSFVAPDGKEVQVYAPGEGMQAELPDRLSSVPVDKKARDRGYRTLLKHLMLKPQHRRWLSAKRGFGDELIDRRLYRSLPKSSDMAAAVDAAAAEMSVEIAAALPGLVVRELGGKLCWTLAARYSGNKDGGFPNQGETGDGLLTPVMDADGLVVALRVRLHELGENGSWEKKVVWLSSNYAGGATPGAPFHHAVPTRPGDHATILVTEGEDKAQAAAEHYGCLALSLPGLNPAAGEAIVRELEKVLGRLQEIKAIRMATDMDPPSNQVARRDAAATIEAVRAFCSARNLAFSVGKWDGAKAKGVDDAIRAGVEVEWLEDDGAMNAHMDGLRGGAGEAAAALEPELEGIRLPQSDDDPASAEIYAYDENGVPRNAPVRWIPDSDGPAVGFFDELEGLPPAPGKRLRLADMAVKEADAPQGRALAVDELDDGSKLLLNRAEMEADRPGLPESAFALFAAQDFSVGTCGILHKVGEGMKRLTVDPIVPVSVSRSLETGEEEICATHWRSGGGATPGWATLRMERRVLASRPHLAAQAAYGLEVNLSNASDLSTYLSAVFRTNSSQLPLSYSSSRMGLLEVEGRWRCLLGRTCITAAGAVNTQASDLAAESLGGSLSFRPGGAGEAALEDVYSTRGDIDGQRDLLALVSPFPKIKVILCAALSASIIMLAGRPGFTLDVYAPNGQSKSTSTRLAASLFGRADDTSGHLGQEVPWSSTAAALELRAGTLSGLPLFIDDSKHLASHGGGQKASDLVYTVGGGGKLRAEMGGTGTRSKRVIRTVVISSGESPLVGLLPPNDGGAVTRILELGHPVPEKSAAMAAIADRIKVGVHKHHGHAGQKWMRYLLAKLDAHDNEYGADSFKDRLNDAIDAEVGRLVAKAPGRSSASRLASYAAAINVAAGLATQCMVKLKDGTEAALFPWEQELVAMEEYPEGSAPPEGIPVGRVIDGEIWAGMLEHAVDSSGEMKALDSVYAWAVANQTAFVGRFDPERDRPREILGAWRQDAGGKPWVALYILLPALEGYLKQQGFVPSQVLAAWKEKGITKCDPGRVTTKSVCIAGSYPRVVAIKREALMAQENGPAPAQQALALG